MKFILIMTGTKADYDQYAKWSKEDLQRNVAFMRAFSKELKDSGVFVSTEGLAWPSEAKLVRAGKDGEPVTDGIFPDPRNFSPGIGSSTWRARRKPTKLPRELRLRQVLEVSREA